MSDSLPTAEAVDTHVAAFERELAAAASPNDAKAAPRSLPRTQEQHRRVVDAADWRRAARSEKEHRPARQRAEGRDRSALEDVRGGGAERRAGRRRRRDAARTPAAAWPPPPVDHRPRSDGRDLHAHGIRDRRRAGGRGRMALLRRAQHAGRASRARHAGHAVPRVADAADRRRRRVARPHDAAHAHLVDADPLHAGASAADPDRRARARLPA